MPTYEYRCQSCRRKFEVLLSYQEYGSTRVTCRHCGSDQVNRLIGRIRVKRNEIDHLADLSDPAALDRIDEDPRALGKMMKEMRSDVGADLGAEFDEVVDRLEKGESPDEIDRSFPDSAAEE
jgi:putative FmdB family regulatory protein